MTLNKLHKIGTKLAISAFEYGYAAGMDDKGILINEERR